MARRCDIIPFEPQPGHIRAARSRTCRSWRNKAYQISTQGLLAPNGTPRPIIDKLADAAPKAMQTPQAQEAFRKQGFEVLNGGPDEFTDYIRRETARWTAVAQAAGLRAS
jgi:tripartite-type tricarboxylate transporter receptor subunit TctC